MKIGLVGYGKMGKAIEKIALERGHSIAFKVDSTNTIDTVNLVDADVCIEFTQPQLAINHIHKLLEVNVPAVIGTTGWGNEFMLAILALV
jgi:4-hydroxy-tetrahydrodipicolinate reductase